MPKKKKVVKRRVTKKKKKPTKRKGAKNPPEWETVQIRPSTKRMVDKLETWRRGHKYEILHDIVEAEYLEEKRQRAAKKAS